MQQMLTNTTKVLVDEKGGANNLLYLPLDKLMQMAQPTVPAAATDALPAAKPADQAATPAPAAAPAADNLFRSREAFRGREREERP